MRKYSCNNKEISVVFITKNITLAYQARNWASEKRDPRPPPGYSYDLKNTLGTHSIYPLLKVSSNTEIDIITSHLDKTKI